MPEVCIVDSSEVHETFHLLNKSNVEYALLRNIDEELPDKLRSDKDIDIIVNPSDKKNLISNLKSSGWQKTIHPWDFGNNFVFLYSMDEFLMYKKGNVHLDICFQLSCRSLNAGEWLPLDDGIQESVFANKRSAVGYPWLYALSIEDELVHLITRSVFDKKNFSKGYVKRIQALMNCTEHGLLENKLRVVFFKFSQALLELVIKGDFANIRSDYLKFKDY